MQTFLVQLCKFLEEALDDEEESKLIYKDALLESMQDLDEDEIHALCQEVPLFAEAYRELTE